MLWRANRWVLCWGSAARSVVVELPKPPWYRRFGVLFLAANLLVAAMLVAAVIALWPPAAQPPGEPATMAAGAPHVGQVIPAGTEPATSLASSTTARREPDVLWQRRGRDAEVGELFEAPGRWRIRWSFDCQNFADHGGGNFKLSGAGAFEEVSVQRFGVRGHGSVLVTGGGRGRLIIESVCDRWMVKAVTA
jgi:hypothetical protein